ncbi:MAG: hypothetical protein H7Y12_10115, partial [Sphingobacteriaceae bacterium]|nr:hypothetical protein [Cytophagaceae bacterium]
MKFPQKTTTLLLIGSILSFAARATQPIPPGHKLLITSVRTGNTDVFWIDPATGDAFNVTKTPKSEERY